MDIVKTKAKPTQAPFFIAKQKVIEIIRSVEAKGGYRYSGLAFGESTANSLVELVQSLASDDDMLKVSKVANEIKRQETCKMPGNANAAINLIIKLVNDAKVEGDQQ
jgi:hypothetical protein